MSRSWCTLRHNNPYTLRQIILCEQGKRKQMKNTWKTFSIIGSPLIPSPQLSKTKPSSPWHVKDSLRDWMRCNYSYNTGIKILKCFNELPKNNLWTKTFPNICCFNGGNLTYIIRMHMCACSLVITKHFYFCIFLLFFLTEDLEYFIDQKSRA
jgi:hypothetical protein